MKATYTNGASVAALVALLLIPVFLAWQGWCLTHVWNWFAPEPLGRVGFLQGVGLNLLLKGGRLVEAEQTPDETVTASHVIGRVAGRQLLVPGFALLAALAVHAIGGGR